MNNQGQEMPPPAPYGVQPLFQPPPPPQLYPYPYQYMAWQPQQQQPPQNLQPPQAQPRPSQPSEFQRQRVLHKPDGSTAHEMVSVSNKTSNSRFSGVITSGKQLKSTIGEGVKLDKADLPEDTLFRVENVSIQNVRGVTQAVYVTMRIISQYNRDNGNIIYDDDIEESARELDFFNYNMEPIGAYVTCTAPKTFGEAWLSGALTYQTVKNGIYCYVLKQGDRFHDANLYMGSVNLAFEFYMMPNDLEQFMNNGMLDKVALTVKCIENSDAFLKMNLKRIERHNKQKSEASAAGNASKIVKKSFQ